MFSLYEIKYMGSNSTATQYTKREKGTYSLTKQSAKDLSSPATRRIGALGRYEPQRSARRGTYLPLRPDGHGGQGTAGRGEAATPPTAPSPDAGPRAAGGGGPGPTRPPGRGSCRPRPPLLTVPGRAHQLVQQGPHLRLGRHGGRGAAGRGGREGGREEGGSGGLNCGSDLGLGGGDARRALGGSGPSRRRTACWDV